MSIPSNISRVHIDRVINEIIPSDIPKERLSYTYYLREAGKSLPPKYVIGLANKYANNEELISDSFNAEEAVAHLKKLKYNIEESIQKANIKLYDIHGSSTINNYKTLITQDEKYFYWDSKKFTRNKIGDIVFWVNRTERVVLYTIIESKEIQATYSNGKNIINDQGYALSATAQDASQFEEFYRFKIVNIAHLPDGWNYSNLIPFNGQTMAIILYEPKAKESQKKIDKIEDLKPIFSDNSEVVKILNEAIELLKGINSKPEAIMSVQSKIINTENMNDISLDFSNFETSDSKFHSKLFQNRGYITFSNSSKGKDKKHFTLGLESFLEILKDIKKNHDSFIGHDSYIEKEWRDLGSNYFTDGPANAMSTVQTKGLFSTLSKIVIWANDPKLKSIDPEKTIDLKITHIDQAIFKLNRVIDKFTPYDKEDFPTISYENILDQFADWFVLENGKRHNYYSKNFSNSKDKLKENLTKYEEEYKKEFDDDVFAIPKGQSVQEFKNVLKENLYLEDGAFYEYSKKVSHHMPRAILGKKNYLKFLQSNIDKKEIVKQSDFDFKLFCSSTNAAGLKFTEDLVVRLISSLVTKPFVILTGLSGSGKTKLAQSFVQWICQDTTQYCIVPVGADWTNREPLLGFPNALNSKEYVKPDNGILDLMLRAVSNYNLPFFLILDEMNLSHVERYFADFLSVMESKDEIPLHPNEEESDNGVPNKVGIPPNLFIIGTVNIDETTYMFSPKVLDRANTIEFRIDEKELSEFLNDNKPINMKVLQSKGASMAVDFLSYSKTKSAKIDKELNKVLINFFGELKKAGAEFGYRTANEIQVLIEQLGNIERSLNDNQKLDIAIMQKLLPKLHGSRRKLEPILLTLGKMCFNNDIKEEDFKNQYFSNTVNDFEANPDIRFSLSLEKICRMNQSAIDHGFASYAEA